MSGLGNVRKLKSGRWQARYTYRGSKYKAPRTFPTKTAALAWLHGEQRLIDLEAWSPPEEREQQEQLDKQRLALTLGDWLKRWFWELKQPQENVRYSSIQEAQKVVTNRILNPVEPGDMVGDVTRLAGLPLASVTTQDVYSWLDAVNRVYDTKETNRKALGRLKEAFSRAVDRDLIADNPASGVSLPKGEPGEKYLPEDWELSAITEAMPPRYRLVAILTFYHGLRIGEALGLGVEDVQITNLSDGGLPSVCVHVCHSLVRPLNGHNFQLNQPKTKAGDRVVPIIPRFVPDVLEHLRKFAGDSPVTVEGALGGYRFLFVTSTGSPVTDTSYRETLRGAKAKAGVVSAVNPHNGRNWLITRLAEQGAHLKEIGALLGQEDVATILDVYMKARPARLSAAMVRVGESLEG